MQVAADQRVTRQGGEVDDIDRGGFLIRRSASGWRVVIPIDDHRSVCDGLHYLYVNDDGTVHTWICYFPTVEDAEVAICTYLLRHQ